MNTEGYNVKRFDGPTKRYVRTMELRGDTPEFFREYERRHAEAKDCDVPEGIREVGILEMEIYRCGKQLVMIVEAPEDFDWDTAMGRLATLPRQAEWEAYMSEVQQASAEATSSEKWRPMARIFNLY